MYKPKQLLLTKYAKVLVQYALNGGAGIKRGETVLIYANECAKPLFMEIYKEVVNAGGNPLIQYQPDEFDRYNLNRYMLESGTTKQLSFFPEAYYKGLLEVIDHHLIVLSTPIADALTGVSPEMSGLMKNQAMKYYKMRTAKEHAGKLSWTMCMYGTPAAAAMVGLTLEQYWEQIIKACYLEYRDPVQKWRNTQREMRAFRDRLNALEIEEVHVTGADVDLHITIGNMRKWLTGSGRNIPSFEIYTSPDWRGTNGWIRFNQPLYYLGVCISGIELHFKDGIVVEMHATENEDALRAMVNQPNANKVGEFSLTDSRHSEITHAMGITLYDENIGGPEGNMHIALGNAYPDTFDGDITLMTPALKEKMGFNVCPEVHTDIITTGNRTVFAKCKNGDELVIYKNGKYLI